VETLVSVYVGALEGDDEQAKKLIEADFAASWDWMTEPPPAPRKRAGVRRPSRQRDGLAPTKADDQRPPGT
jgi:hypothetical protein